MATNKQRHTCNICKRKLIQDKMYNTILSKYTNHNNRNYNIWICNEHKSVLVFQDHKDTI